MVEAGVLGLGAVAITPELAATPVIIAVIVLALSAVMWSASAVRDSAA